MKIIKRIISSTLVIVMLASLLLSAFPLTASADNPDNYLQVHFDFTSLDNGTIVANKGKATSVEGVVRNNAEQAFSVTDESIYGKQMKAIYLNGGSSSQGNYVQINNMDLSGMGEVTISCWVNIKGYSGYQRIWDFGNGNTTRYMYLLTDGANSGHTGYTSAITNSGWSNEQGPEKGTSLPTNEWVFTTVTYDSNKQMTLYEDGKEIGTTQCDVPLSDIASGESSYIGYGQFGNDIGAMQVADFRIYSKALTSAEVMDLYGISDDERVQSDLDNIDLGDTTQVTANLTLPTEGVGGSSISWTSDNPSVVDVDGTVTRPSSTVGNVTVTLTATATYGNTVKTKDFSVTVISYADDASVVAHDLAALDLGDLSIVTNDLSLITQGDWGSTLVWNTNDSPYLSSGGTVTRPPAGSDVQKVTFSVTASFGSASDTRTFEATIRPVYLLPTVTETESVAVTTSLNVYPSLPTVIKVKYNDGSSDSLKVRWNDVPASNYESVGTFTVDGKIVDTDVIVTATVTVEVAAAQTPQKSASSFDLSKVSLDGDTLLTENKERAETTILNKNPDTMLYNFRKAFGVDTKGASAPGGWEAANGLLRGHGTGHYLSALSLAYASSTDETEKSQLKSNLDYMLTELLELQKMSKGSAKDFQTVCTPANAAQNLWSTDPSEWGEGYISAYAPDHFALLEQYTPYATIWAPYYTLHKLMAGFIDAYEYTGNTDALELATGMGSWVYERLTYCTDEAQRTKMWSMYIAGEYGGMNEVMSKLYEITGEQKYLDTAKMFDNTTFFDNLANNIDDVGGRHANQHIPQIVGALAVYDSTNDPYYYNVAKNFWDIVTSKYAYSTGGVGRGESFRTAYDLAANIDSTTNCETCAAYNMLKLTNGLYQYDPDNAAYMDYYERTLINSIVSSQAPYLVGGSHAVTYMLPIGPGASRSGDSGSWTCCYGTGLENHVKYQEAAYFTTEDTLYVNLYMPTTLTWSEKGAAVKQECEFPARNSKITISGGDSFELKLRVPYWATEGFEVTVNGQTVITEAEPSSYVSLGEVSDGDVIEISMPFSVHLDKTPDTLNGNTVASVMYGPLVMITENTSTDYLTLTVDSKMEEYVTVNEEDDISLEINGMSFVPMYKGWGTSSRNPIYYHTYFYINVDGVVEATEIKLDASSLVILRKKDTLKLNVNVTPANASPNISWTSSNSDVASIDENGLVTANKVGTVQIKASTDNGLERSIVIRISA